MGFFDTVFWSRRLKTYRQSKTAAIMTIVPQFTVPEIFVEDELAHDDTPGPFDGGNYLTPGFGPPSIPSSVASSPRTGAITPSTDGDEAGMSLSMLPPLRTRISASSIQISPTASPTHMAFPGSSPTRTRFPGHAHSASGSSIGEDWQLAQALSRPVSRDGPGEGPSTLGPSPVRGRGNTLSANPAEDGESRSRANSSVSAKDVLEVLDNSAWGESIRKSFSTRRPSGEEKRKN